MAGHAVVLASYDTHSVSCSTSGITATTITCATVASSSSTVSSNWYVTVDGQISAISGVTTKYYNPVITSLSGSYNQLNTTGGTDITLTGLYFGVTGAITVIQYGPYTSLPCTMLIPDTKMRCTTVAGLGFDYGISVVIGGVTQSQSATSTTGLLLSYARPIITSVQGVPLSTAGGTDITLTGLYFGITGAVTVITYGPYTSLPCTTIVAGTKMRCTTVAGLGFDYGISVVIDTVTYSQSPTSTTGLLLSYARPIITSVTGAPLATTGGTNITLTGLYFGTTGVVTVITYGPYMSLPCTTIVADTKMSCPSVIGVGINYGISVVIDTVTYSQSPTTASDLLVSYSRPVITNVTTTNDVPLSTTGGTIITIKGNSMGTAGLDVVVRYFYGLVSTMLTATNCIVTVDDTEVQCTTQPGVGTNLIFNLTMAGQSSIRFGSNVSYALHDVTSISSTSGGEGMSIMGGTYAVLTGTGFGPSGYESSYYSATYGPTSTQFGPIPCLVLNDNTIKCKTAAGIGSGHLWRLTIAERTIDVAPSLMTFYELPSITSVAPDLSTNGTTQVTIVGTGFGPISTHPIWSLLGASVKVSYFNQVGHQYDPIDNCTVTKNSTSSTTMICPTIAGSGICSWNVSVAGQDSGSYPVIRSYRSPFISAITPLSTVITDGGTWIEIDGHDFGPADESSDWLPVVTYGAISATEYTATNCYVSIPHIQVKCQTTSGVGTNHRFIVTCNGLTSPISAATLSYARPSITDITIPTVLDTLGGTLFQIDGNNLGCSTTGCYFDSYVRYGPQEFPDLIYNASCYVVIPHSLLECTTIVGIGAHLTFQVIVGNQSSDWMTPTISSSYHGPLVYSMEWPGTQGFNTMGGDLVTIYGQYFGDFMLTSEHHLFVTYGPVGTFTNLTALLAQTCYVSNDYTIVCTTVPGTGGNLGWIVNIANQGSPLNTTVDLTYYNSPTITSLTSDILPTYGGTVVIIHGTDFGPSYSHQSWAFLNNSVRAWYGPLDDLQKYEAISCRSLGYVSISCTTVPSTGCNLYWHVNVGGLVSTVSPNSTCHTSPTITSTNHTNLPFPTTGGVSISLNGTNMGIVGTLPLVTFGPTGVEFNTSDCIVTVDHQVTTCIVGEGWGSSHRWIITVDGITGSPSWILTSYQSPVITDITGAINMSTVGGETVTLTGLNFGPVDSNAIAHAWLNGSVHGLQYHRVAACTVLQSHFRLECITPVGAGANYTWSITIGYTTSFALTSVAFPTIRTSYRPPVIDFISPTVLSSTSGLESILISGSMFGPNDGSYVITGSYGTAQYQLTGFSILNDNEVLCYSSAGVGYGHSLKIIVGTQTSNSAIIAYPGNKPSSVTLSMTHRLSCDSSKH
jgi:hypothetical protein